MRQALILVNNIPAGKLLELEQNAKYRFIYDESYQGMPVSLTMPTSKREYEFPDFPPFFDGLLPEGIMLEALLKGAKIDRNDRFSQLIAVGEDVIGNVSVRNMA